MRVEHGGEKSTYVLKRINTKTSKKKSSVKTLEMGISIILLTK